MLTTGAALIADSLVGAPWPLVAAFVIVGVALLYSTLAAAVLAVRAQLVGNWDVPWMKLSDATDEHTIKVRYCSNHPRRCARGSVGRCSRRETAGHGRFSCPGSLTRAGRIGRTTKSVGEPGAVADGRHHAGRSIPQCRNVSFALAGVSPRLINVGRLVGEPSRRANEHVAGILLGDESSHDVGPKLEQVHRVNREATHGRKGVQISVRAFQHRLAGDRSVPKCWLTMYQVASGRA